MMGETAKNPWITKKKKNKTGKTKVATPWGVSPFADTMY